MSLRLRKSDVVVVLKGRGAGKRGKILRFEASGPLRAYVEGVNLVKRFVRRTRQNPQGGSVERESAIAVGNLALYCNQCGKPARYRTQLLKDGTKSRHCVKCKSVLGEG